MIKSARAVYQWIVRQAFISNRVVSCTPTGEEAAIETAERAVLEGKGSRLGPDELGLLAKRLAAALNPVEATGLRERLTAASTGFKTGRLPDVSTHA